MTDWPQRAASESDGAIDAAWLPWSKWKLPDKCTTRFSRGSAIGDGERFGTVVSAIRRNGQPAAFGFGHQDQRCPAGLRSVTRSHSIDQPTPFVTKTPGAERGNHFVTVLTGLIMLVACGRTGLERAAEEDTGADLPPDVNETQPDTRILPPGDTREDRPADAILDFGPDVTPDARGRLSSASHRRRTRTDSNRRVLSERPSSRER